MSNAQFLADLALFDRSAAQGCREVLGEGRLLVVPLEDCAREPVCYTVEVDTAALGDTSVTLTVTVPAAPQEINIYRGEVLTFPSGTVVTTQDATITDAGVVVTVEPLAQAFAAAETTEVFSVYDVCSLSSLPISHNIGTENNKVLKDGIQGSSTKTNVQPSSNIEGFLRVDDDGLWSPGLIFDSARSDVIFYGAMLRLNERQMYWGPFEVTAFDMSDQVEQLQKFTATITLQAGWSTAPQFDYLTTAEQDALNRIRNLFGLSTLVAM
jgi:hypothetical protein